MMWHGKNFRGIINKAKEMIFDNTGTGLISTNAEDAIKEVNSNLSDFSNLIALYNSGRTLDGSTKQLTDSIANYKIIIVDFTDNGSNITRMYPSQLIQNNIATHVVCTLSVAGIANDSGYTGSPNIYGCGYCQFLSNTSFKATCVTSSPNWGIGVAAIWGIK